ncbi:hypothetical protein LB518_22675 [Mesorhizobium sp. BR1-1-16]|uniref:DUF7940 domain-containing protein n=1 Tax=Mesorhizobium sp. BR1-1-16 TaxID=2876653 RepID=UPI001CCF6D56|nr:hypothetical protein [Mesorhizobium sp. BR1-1-16]MBZ9939119.1 hypothetical protein [Mesorhizobium sp. BR1-1-16]
MKLVDDWRSILARAWSMRFIYAGAFCGAAALALPFVADQFADQRVFAGILFAAQVGAVIFPALAGYARVVDQPKMRRRSHAGR